MRLANAVAVVVVLAATAMAKCLPIAEAPSRTGDAACITGEVRKVIVREDGSHRLDFCGGSANCAFTAIVPARYLRDVGDVRMLEGKTVEIYGHITAYHGVRDEHGPLESVASEMLLKDIKQLRGEAAKIPKLPKGYDVAKRGHVSAGEFKPTKQTKAKKPKSLYDNSIEDSMSSEN
jgi:hypothetical protein